MAIEVRIPKEITEYQEKILFGLSLRQLGCFSLALVAGVGTFYLANEYAGRDLASYITMLIVMPIFAVGFVKKNGFTFEKYIAIMLKHYLGVNRRGYETNLLIEQMIEQINLDNGEGDNVVDTTKTRTKKIKSNRTKKATSPRREVEGFKISAKSRKRKRKEALREIKAARQEYRKKEQESFKTTEESSSTKNSTSNNKIQKNV